MRVLVVEDDPIATKLIDTALSRRNCVIEHAESGEETLELVRHYDFDIVLLDLRLPDIDGAELVRRIRAMQIDVPVLMLSGDTDRHVRIETLLAGADDYLTKPFDQDELAARLQAIVRRSKGHSASIIRVGRMTLDLNARSVTIDGEPLHVTQKEYGILELLSLRKGMTLTKETFLDHLYGGMDEPEQKIIDVFICKLRKKIQAMTGEPHNIETVWGRGYMLKESAPREPEAGLAEPRAGWDQGPLDELDRLLLALLPSA